MKLKIALAQLLVAESIDSNLQGILRGLRYAKEEGAQLLLTPEGSLSGYTHDFDRALQRKARIEVEETARELGVGMVLGTCQEEDDGVCYNEQRFYTSEGEFVGFHAKILRCGTLKDPPQGEINHYGTKPLQTFSLFGITVGGLICNDLWATPGYTPVPDPHLVWQLRKMGAQIIFHSVNGGGDGTEFMSVYRAYHASNLSLWAKASHIPIVSVDALAAPGIYPVACQGGVVNANGERVFSLPDTGEQMGVWELDIS